MRPQVSFVALVAIVLGCKPAPTSPPFTPPTPITITTEQFGSITWLFGKWRGAEGDGPPFFETYRRIDDSTIARWTHWDSTSGPSSDTGWITLRHGVVRSDTSYTATSWDSNSVHFEPEVPHRNSFTWTKVSANEWTGTLNWTGQDGSPKSRVYTMKRLPDP